MKKKIIWLLGICLLLLITVILVLFLVGMKINNTKIINEITTEITTEDCNSHEGRIVNTLSLKEPYCEDNELNLGYVTGLNCPCVCCVNKDNLKEKLSQEILNAAQNSECGEKGYLNESSYYYNNFTKTWWISLEMKPEFENSICNPACVVIEDSLEAEINYMCTGALV